MLTAVDLGFGAVKARDEEDFVEFPSAIGPFRPIRFTSGLEHNELSERLCIEYKGKKYFVGNMAFTQSTPRVTMNANRFISDEGMALMMTSLIMLSGYHNINMDLVAGLPVNDYKDLIFYFS